MDYKPLHELSEIFRHRGDAEILISLAVRPSLRYRELGRAVSEETGDRLADGEITRCLPRLKANGLLLGEGPPRQQLYRLTPSGQDKAALLRFILNVLEDRDDEPPGDRPPPRRSQPGDYRRPARRHRHVCLIRQPGFVM